MPNASDLGFIALSALAAAGFAGIVAGRIRLALESRRAGNRFETIRSALVAGVLSLFVLAATYISIVRVMAAFATAQ